MFHYLFNPAPSSMRNKERRSKSYGDDYREGDRYPTDIYLYYSPSLVFIHAIS
jgi:hypothetical protein